ncbi:MAG: endonuclease/exonuclease/phosphatase family protein [Chryseotalea sp.]
MRLFHIVVASIFLFACQEQIQEQGTPQPPVNNNPDQDNSGTPVSGKYANCLNVLDNTTFDIVTWNIEQFSTTNTNLTLLAEMIIAMDADVIGVQEINSRNAFDALLTSLPSYSGKLYLNGSLGQGYIYKNSEITNLTDLTLWFVGETSPFPRPLVVTTATHTSGKQVMLVNVHLKCCDDGIARRREASTRLKSFIDTNFSTTPIVVLGDFNDEIDEPVSDNVFQNLIADSNNYAFADMSIATGSNAFWSYPSYPSHIDHHLISNELFASKNAVKTIRFEFCDSRYSNEISDHRPVLLQLK